MFDASPVIGVVTGLSAREPSRNAKTGPMAQLWVLRADQHPYEAIQTRQDYSVCGDCRLRGEWPAAANRACYVKMDGPGSIYKAWRRGIYPVVDPGVVNDHLRRRGGRALRLGAYGDPCALPAEVIAVLVSCGVKWTGYTHQWREWRSQRYREWLMASVETEGEAKLAQAMGWRTFRVRTADQPLMDAELICPASIEAGHRLTCEKCGVCKGATAGNRHHVAIIVHGHPSRERQFIQVLRRSR